MVALACSLFWDRLKNALRSGRNGNYPVAGGWRINEITFGCGIMLEMLPKVGKTYRIWKTIERLALENYDQLAGETMRGSYYIMREWLEPLRNSGEITDVEFDYFLDNYQYYRDDLWTRLERKHGIHRPETKPPTIVIERGEEFTEAHLPVAWDRARGFIFIEKSGMARKLTPLSHYGWLIVAAQGESTRTFREFAYGDETKRLILGVTDADYFGRGIIDTLMGYSKRTEHLGLWRRLADRVIELGLSTADADAMDLPRERDPTKSPDRWRTELDALTVLRARHGIDNPLLAYVVEKMLEFDIPLCPLPYEEPEKTVKRVLTHRVRAGLTDLLGDVVDDAVGDIDDFERDLPHGYDGEGEFVELCTDFDMETVELKSLGELEDALKNIAESELRRLYWRRRTAYEKKNVLHSIEDDVRKIREMLG